MGTGSRCRHLLRRALLPGRAHQCGGERGACGGDDVPLATDLLEGSTVLASGRESNVTGTKTPFEFLTFQNTADVPRNLDLVLGRFSASGAPRMKLIGNFSLCAPSEP